MNYRAHPAVSFALSIGLIAAWGALAAVCGLILGVLLGGEGFLAGALIGMFLGYAVLLPRVIA